MVHRIILYKFHPQSDAQAALGEQCARIRAAFLELEPALELSFARPADHDAERAWDLCVRLSHANRPWRGEQAEALDRRVDQELGSALAVRKSWSFEGFSPS